MNTNPAYDNRTSMFERALDTVVEFLLPAGSGPERLLHFQLEAVNDNTGESIRYGVVFCRPSNYTQVYGYIHTGEDEVVLSGDSSNWGSFKSVPANEVMVDEHGRVARKPKGFFDKLKSPVILGRLHTTRGGGGGPGVNIILPGKLVCYANHDSCWTDYGVKTLRRFRRDEEDHFDVHEITRYKVLSVSVTGNVSKHYKEDAGPGQTWENPNPDNLVDHYALFTAAMALADCPRRHRSLRFNVDWNLYEEREPVEKGEKQEGRYNYRRRVADVTPRTQDWWSPLRGEARLWFNEEGKVIRFHDQDIEPATFSRDFVMSAWDLPKTDKIYALDRFSSFLDGGTFLSKEVRDYRKDLRQPRLDLPEGSEPYDYDE